MKEIAAPAFELMIVGWLADAEWREPSCSLVKLRDRLLQAGLASSWRCRRQQGQTPTDSQFDKATFRNERQAGKQDRVPTLDSKELPADTDVDRQGHNLAVLLLMRWRAVSGIPV